MTHLVHLWPLKKEEIEAFFLTPLRNLQTRATFTRFIVQEKLANLLIDVDVGHIHISVQQYHLVYRLVGAALTRVKRLFRANRSQTRENRAGWPLLTVETEVNGDSKSTNERGPSLVGSLCSSCLYKRRLSCLGCSDQPSSEYFFPYHTLF